MPLWTNEESTRILRAASDRIGADLQRTVGRSVEVRLNTGDNDFAEVMVYLDGRLDAGFGLPLGNTVEESIVEIADLLQEYTLHEEIGGGWPTCIRHGTHPVTPVVREDQAVWWCPTDEVVVARIGDLTEVG